MNINSLLTLRPVLESANGTVFIACAVKLKTIQESNHLSHLLAVDDCRKCRTFLFICDYHPNPSCDRTMFSLISIQFEPSTFSLVMRAILLFFIIIIKNQATGELF